MGAHVAGSGARFRTRPAVGVRALEWQNQEPGSELKALEVVELQLRALQENNPQTDDGIAKTFEFASPANQAATGPLPRFAAMIRGGYSQLLNSREFTIVSGLAIGERAGFGQVYVCRVQVLAQDQ